MAALISRFVNVPIASACPARCPPQPQPGPHPSWLPSGRLKDCTRQTQQEFFFPFFLFLFFLFFCSTTVTHFLKISPSQPPPLLIPLSYSLPVVHSVTVCFTLDRPLSHSLRPASIIYLSSIAVSFSFAAFLSLVNSSFLSSAHSLPIHCIFQVFSHFTSIASLHLVPSFCPIIFSFNSDTLCFHLGLLSVSVQTNTSHCIPPPLLPSVSPSLSLHLHTIPSVFARH